MTSSAIPTTNDGSSAPPRLRRLLALGNLLGLPETSHGPRGNLREMLLAVQRAGYEGTQGGDPALSSELGLAHAMMGRLDAPDDADRFVARCVKKGACTATLHVGTGLESDAEMDRLVSSLLEACARHSFPVYVETHRATITQDVWRTVELVKRFPEIRFNGDFSHWYTGLELPYGDFSAKLDFLAPVFERVRFLHGRVGDPGSIQVDVGDGSPRLFLSHFREMWVRAMVGFLANASPGDYLCFVPELLGPELGYARRVPGPGGALVEETDRWEQALVLCAIAGQCFVEAERRRAQAR